MRRRFRPPRSRKRIELPVPPAWYYDTLEKQKQNAEKRMAVIDALDPELRAVVNGVGDLSAARSFLDRGVRTTRDAENLRASIGLAQMEKAEAVQARSALGQRVTDGIRTSMRSQDVDQRGLRERAEAAVERARHPPPKPEPVVDPKTAADRANSIFARLREQS
jgi:hypothetical protein